MGRLAYILVDPRAYRLRIICSILSRSAGRHRKQGEVVYDGSSEGGILERIVVVRETGRVYRGTRNRFLDMPTAIKVVTERDPAGGENIWG